MFGHSDNQQVNTDGAPLQQNPDPMASNGQAMPADTQNQAIPQAPNAGYGLGEIPAASPSIPQNNNPFTMPASPVPEPSQQPDFSAASAPVTTPASPVSGDEDLLDLKQKALQELSPLVDHLEQNPEEKFKTTMMMIQASDDQALLPAAYQAAQAITDEKAKAQALLDVVNEINYFTQSH